MNNLSTEYLSDKKFSTLLYLFLVGGLLFRIFHFFYNRSLWMDEVYLSTSLLKMNYLELATQPLYYQQKAPVGFLWLCKLTVDLFGNKETCLRIVPMLSGSLSLLAFIPVAKHFLNKWGTLIAVGILCFSPALVYHSVEIKQYSTELLCSILCFYTYIKYKENKQLKNRMLWGITGAVIIWFSYSSVFILAGIGIGLSIRYLLKKDWKALFLSMIPFSIWLISFLTNYILFTSKHADAAWTAYWFRSYGNFMPLPIQSLKDLTWFPLNFYRMLDYPLGMLWNFIPSGTGPSLGIVLKMPFIAIILFAIGIWSFYKWNKTNLGLLLMPVLLMLLASGLELYPLTERFWVFISPVFIITIARGFDQLTANMKHRKFIPFIFLLVIAGPFVQSILFVVKPEQFYIHKKSFQREALMYINKNYKVGDLVYIYWNDLPGYRLYKQMYKFNYTAVEGSDQRKNAQSFKDYFRNLKPDFDKISSGKRVWIVYNTKYLTDIGDKIDDPAWYYQKNQNPTDHLIKEMFKFGSPIKRFNSNDISVYLIDTSIKK